MMENRGIVLETTSPKKGRRATGDREDVDLSKKSRNGNERRAWRGGGGVSCSFFTAIGPGVEKTGNNPDLAVSTSPGWGISGSVRRGNLRAGGSLDRNHKWSVNSGEEERESEAGEKYKLEEFKKRRDDWARGRRTLVLQTPSSKSESKKKSKKTIEGSLTRGAAGEKTNVHRNLSCPETKVESGRGILLEPSPQVDLQQRFQGQKRKRGHRAPERPRLDRKIGRAPP